MVTTGEGYLSRRDSGQSGESWRQVGLRLDEKSIKRGKRACGI